MKFSLLLETRDIKSIFTIRSTFMENCKIFLKKFFIKFNFINMSHECSCEDSLEGRRLWEMKIKIEKNYQLEKFNSTPISKTGTLNSARNTKSLQREKLSEFFTMTEVWQNNEWTEKDAKEIWKFHFKNFRFIVS